MNADPRERLERRRRAEASALLASDAARAALGAHGTPLLLLEPSRITDQLRRLRTALPFVDFHYAVKANPHDSVIAALAAAGCGFDIATGEELALLARHGVPAGRMIHTHPIKKPSEIAEAIAAGVDLFVVDNEAEVAKFAGTPARVMVRLAYRSPHAKSDLSTKFGVGPVEAERLVALARRLGVRVAGFSYHVGSQLDDPQRFAEAARETLALMTTLERRLGDAFDVLDIGGGLPVSYDDEVHSIAEATAPLREILAPYAHRYRLLAEPGRVLVAESMTLVTSVVGVAERPDGRWYYLDDGLYGAYSNALTEDVHPLIFAERELAATVATADRRSATLAGPTCDSSDVIAREAPLPDLSVGDRLISPVMGAYTTVTATRFNGRPITPVAVLPQRTDAAPAAAPAEQPAARAVRPAPHTAGVRSAGPLRTAALAQTVP